MQRIRHRLVAAVMPLVLAACAAAFSYRNATSSDFDSLVPGMSSVQVERQLGQPATKLLLPRFAEEVWEYRYFDGHTPKIAQLHFDLGGVLRRRLLVEDRDYYHGGAEL